MTVPLIISAPHACRTVSPEVKKRLLLSDYQIWQLNDPFTDETCQHPKAFAHHIGDVHRLCCDLSHGNPPTRPFGNSDFYGRPIYKPGQEFTTKERQYFLKNHAEKFRENITESIKKLANAGCEQILFVDHHNTAGDHPVGKTGKYMPVIDVCNGGAAHTGEPLDDEEVDGVSCPAEFLQTFKRGFESSLGLPAEINTVYSMSHTGRWILNEVQPKFPQMKIHLLFLEYNLSFIHNPVTQKNDSEAKEKIHQAINGGIDVILEKYFRESDNLSTTIL